MAVFLLELVRLLLQNKWGTMFRQEWFWKMQGLLFRSKKGVLLRANEKTLRGFDASLEWLVERIGFERRNRYTQTMVSSKIG